MEYGIDLYKKVKYNGIYFTEIFSIYGGGGLDALLDIGRVNKQVFNHMVVVGSWGECLLGP